MELYYQALLEKWLKLGWTVLAVVSVAVAYAAEDQTLAWKACALASIVATVVAVPDWPVYQRHSVVFTGVEVTKEQREGKSAGGKAKSKAG